MSVPSTQALSRVHTFAQDLEQERSRRGLAAPTAHNSPEVKITSTTADSTVAPTTTSISVPKSKSSPQVPDAPIKLSATASRDASYEATIITDTKRQKLSLLTAIQTSVVGWWQGNQKKRQDSKKPKYTVPVADRRKGVIEKATSETGRHATEDHHEIVARLKGIPSTTTTNKAPTDIRAVPLATNFIVPEEKAEVIAPIGYEAAAIIEPLPTISIESADTFATHTELTQPTTPLVEEKIERIVPIIPSVPVRDADTPIDTPKRITPIIPNLPVFAVPPPPITDVAELEYSARPSLPIIETLTEPETPTLPATFSQAREGVAARREASLALPTDTRETKQGWHLLPYIAGGVFVIISISAVTYLVLQNTKTSPTTNAITLPGLPSGENASSIDEEQGGLVPVVTQLEAGNRAALYRALTSVETSADSLQFITPLAYDTLLPLSSRDLLTLINQQLPVTFTSNIYAVRVGTYETKPVLVLSVTNDAVIRGELFTWEQTMSQDLSPWFGQTIRKGAIGNQSPFVDATIAGTDVRILTDDTNTAKITYGFINQSTVLITTTKETFESIVADENLSL